VRKTIKISPVKVMTLQASGAIKGPGSLPFWRKSAVAAALLLAMGFTALDAQALALGRVNVQSALGEPLRAEIDVPDINPDEAASLKAAVAGPDAFKAAGLEYNAALSNVQISLQKRPDGRSYLRLTSDRPMTEPFVDLILEASWAAGRMVRDYTMLFDPPNLRVMPAPAAITAPIISSGAPRSVVTPSGVTPRPTATAPAPVYITEEAAPAPKRSSPASPRAARAPRAERVEIAAPSAGEIVVKKGNTAAQLAMRYKPAGVSLDQMLVSMLSTNPDAFVNGNVNRLKAGVVLDLPSAAATAESTSRTAARQVIVAQSKDFNEFRRRLAQGAPGTAAPTASRKATGTVQAKVEESKANTTSPDKLTLSKAAAAAKGVKEEIIAKEKQAKDAAARTAELTKNLQDLTRLGATTTTATAKPAAALASAAATGAKNTGAGAAVGALNLPEPASASAAVKAAATASSAAASPVPAVASATPASSAVAVPAPVSSAAVAPAASVASVAKASTVTAAPTAPAAPVPQAGASAAKPGAPATPPAPPVAEASLVDSLLNNPVTLPAAGGLLALLGGFGAWRWRQRKKNEQKDSSFLESRLQPDSFFGASGGQRIDTNNSVANSAAVPGGSSSMVYSPSQLDAAGDVDPVAEADVYLAYGRDLQAEEILKEALRMQPTRIAVHAKLLEIYAKRRDTKAFESLAKEAYRVSNGQGPEWESACALGRELDPNNNLYQGGDLPRASAQASPAGKIGSLAGAGVLAAGTAAASAVSTAGKSVPAPDANAEVDFDLNLDFDPAPATIAKPTPDPYLSAPASLPPARIARGNQGGDPHFQAPEEDSHHTTAMELRSEVDDPLDFGFDAPALPIIASGPRDTVKLSGADMDSFSNSLSFSAKPPVKTPSTSTAPMAMNTNPVNATNPLEFDFGNLSLDLPKTNTDITSAVAASAAVDAGITGDPLETKLALAQEFREIGDFDGARAMAEEVFAEAKGPLKARAQRMVADLS
jgi:pilus assembly protein FimV